MPRFDCCKCLGGSIAVVLYILWYLIPTIVLSTLVLASQDATVVFWTLIGSTGLLVFLTSKFGFTCGFAIPSGCPGAMWTFEPFKADNFWSPVHLASATPLHELTNLIVSIVWVKTFPLWLMVAVWLAPPIMFTLSMGVGVVVARSYDNSQEYKRVNDENTLLV